MKRRSEVTSLALPDRWPRYAKTAIINAISMAATSFVYHLEHWGNVLRPDARACAELDRRDAHIARLRDELRIKDERMLKIPARRRPRYSPAARLEILEHRAAQGWTMARTARRFLVDENTIAGWARTLGEQGRDSLTRISKPVNRFPEYVRYLVQRLKNLCPAMGKVKIAEMLARAGLHIAATTVGRFLASEPDGPVVTSAGSELPADAEPVPENVVTSKRPGHLGHVDMTVVPTELGGFWFAISGSLPVAYPFCYWLIVCQDHFSRRIQGFELFRKEPTSRTVQLFLERVFDAVGRTPKHMVFDKGRQFDCHCFRGWCGSRGIRWRYGAAGKKGSIAVVERLIRSIKDECTRRIRVPFRMGEMRDQFGAYVRWYNECRPHMWLRGRTPDEVYFKRKPANERPRLEPRIRYPRDAWCASPQTEVRGRRGVRVDIEVSYYEGKQHLPLVTVRPAA